MRFGPSSLIIVARIAAGDLRSCLTGKLRAEESSGSHPTFRIKDENGVIIATMRVSHSWRHSTIISDSMVQQIARQLRLSTSSQLVALVECTLSRENYLDIVLPRNGNKQ